MLFTILLIVLLVLIVGGGGYRYHRAGDVYAPGGVDLVLLILVILIIAGFFWHPWGPLW